MKKKIVSSFFACVLAFTMLCTGVVPAEELTSGDDGFRQEGLLLLEEEDFSEALMAEDAAPDEVSQNPDLIVEEEESMLLPEETEELTLEEEAADPAEADSPEEELIAVEEETEEAGVSGSCGANLTWELQGSKLLIRGSGRMNDYQMKVENGTESTTAPWFRYNGRISEIDIGEDVTYIGSYAFAFMTNIDYNGISSALTFSMGTGAYAYSSVKEVIVFPGLKEIPRRAYTGCDKLQNIMIQGGVETIGASAFEECENLEQIWFHGGSDPNYALKTISAGAFGECSSLSEIILDNGVTGRLPESLQTIEACAFQDCTALKTLEIPDTVTRLGADVFRDCTSLTDITLPSGLKDISPELLKGCRSLKSVLIPDTVTRIQYMAFQDCKALQEVAVPESVKAIETNTFKDAGLKKVVFYGNAPELFASDEYIVRHGNEDPDLQHIFTGCTADGYYPVKNATWTADIRKKMGGNITWKTGSYTGTCGKNLTYELFEDGALYIKGTGEMYHYSAESPAPYTKHGVTIKKVFFSSGASTIGKSAFENQTGLTQVSVPGTVQEIFSRAFYGCKNLRTVSLSQGLLEVGSRSFSGCTSLEELQLPASIRDIYSYAFENCSALKKLVLPAIEKIAAGTCYGCKGLESLDIPMTIKVVEKNAFYNCAPKYCRYRGYALAAIGFLNEAAITGYENLPHITQYDYTEDDVPEIYQSHPWIITKQPAVLSAVNETEGIRITWAACGWDPVNEKDQYVIYRSCRDDNYSKRERLGTVPSSSTTFLDKKAVSGKSYRYSVTTQKYFEGNGTHQAWLHDQSKYQFMALSRIGTPVVSSVENLRDNIIVRWNKISGASGYRILRKEAKETAPLGSYGPAGSYVQIGSVSGDNLLYFKDTTAKAGVKYTYTVRAVLGNTLGAYYKTGKTIVRLLVPSITRLDNNAAGIGVCWQPSTGATGYAVLRLEGKNWKTIAKVEGNKTTYYTDPEVKSGFDKVYTYSVRARRDGSVGSYSTVGKSLYRLKNTSITKLTNLAGRQLKVEWLKVGVANGYKIEYALTKDFKVYGSVESPYKNTLQYTLKNLALNKIYYVRIRPYKLVDGVKHYGIYSGVKMIKITR